MSYQPKTRRFAGANGIGLVADVGGDPGAAPVILMHGGGQTRHSWDEAMYALVARGFHVINIDARGHGDSDWAQDGDYSMSVLADDLLAVMGTLSRPPALVGASMGASTALHTVGNCGGDAAALAMVDLVPRVETAGAEKIAAFMRAHEDGFESVEEAADAVAAYYPNRPRPKDPSGLMKNLRRRDDGRLHWHWDPKFIRQSNPMEPPQLADVLLTACKGVRIPTLLIRGMKSDIVSDAGVAEFREHLPQLEVADISGAGHMVVGDKNDVFNKALLDFLERSFG